MPIELAPELSELDRDYAKQLKDITPLELVSLMHLWGPRHVWWCVCGIL